MSRTTLVRAANGLPTDPFAGWSTADQARSDAAYRAFALKNGLLSKQSKAASERNRKRIKA